MPTYEFACPHHGPFDEVRPFSRSAEAGACPRCGAAAARLISVPNLRGMPTATRVALERNERSRHAPHFCHSGCTHRAVAATTATTESRLHDYRGPRPWVVEHA